MSANKALAIRPARKTFRVNGRNVVLIDHHNPYTHSGYAIRWNLSNAKSGHWPGRIVVSADGDRQTVFEIFDDNTVFILAEEKNDGEI